PSTLPPPPRSTLFPYTTLFRSSLASQGGVRSDPQVELAGQSLLQLLLDEDPNQGLGLVRTQEGRDRDRSLSLRGRRKESKETAGDRKSTRLNSSHVKISYAVFC